MYSDARQYLDEVSRAAGTVNMAVVNALLEMVADVAVADGTVFVAGNGGSATVADHFAIGMSLNALREAGRGVRAQSLNASGVLLTGAANDFGFAEMFASQLRTQARPGDLFLGLSASGRSANVARAVEVAGELGLRTAVIVGALGPVAVRAHLTVLVETPSAAICEDVSIMLLHWVYGRFMEKPA